jgi:hypothetical protein
VGLIDLPHLTGLVLGRLGIRSRLR